MASKPSVTPKHRNESFEAMLRRFKRAVEKDGVLDEIRRREFFEKPSIVRKRNKAAAVKRNWRKTQIENMSVDERKRHAEMEARKSKKKDTRGRSK